MCYKTLLSPSLFFTEKTLKRMQLCTQMCVSWRFPLRPSLPIRSWCICKIWRKLWFLCTKLKVLQSLADSFTALLACGQWYCGRHWPFRHQSPVSCVCFPFHRRRTKSSFKFHCRGSFGWHQNISTFEQRLQQTRPSKQCGFCNYLLDLSLISQDCHSGLIGQSGQGAKVSRSKGLKVSRSQGLKV